MSAGKAGKRPLRSLTAHEKLDAIRRVHDGESKASVARDIGVPESTLRGWCKNEDKISYLSRQSSPDTDESLDFHHKDKRLKLDEPFNLCLKGSPSPADFSSKVLGDLDLSKSSNLSAKAETPKTGVSERERNRAELARLSIELGLNRPEMFMSGLNNGSSSSTSNINDLANMSLLWNNLLMQKTMLGGSSSGSKKAEQHQGLLKTVDQPLKPTLPEKQQSAHDAVWYWLKTQQSMLGMTPSATPSASLPTTNAVSSSSSSTMQNAAAAAAAAAAGNLGDQSSWFWKWYKQLAYGQQQLPTGSAALPPDAPPKPILYQQLTKECDDKAAAAAATEPTTAKARSVLDNLLLLNNNNNQENEQKRDEENEEAVGQGEAVEHGEKFLQFLETFSDPSITAMQIMQFRSLLNNVRSCGKGGDNSQTKTKVKRK